MKRREDSQLQCPICGTLYKRQETLRKHFKMHFPNIEGSSQLTYFILFITEIFQVPDNAPHAPNAPQVPDAPQVLHAPHVPHAPQVFHAPQVPDVPDAPHVPHAPDAPDVPQVLHVPQVFHAPQVLNVPGAPDAPDVPDALHAPDVPHASDAPHIAHAPQVPDTPQNPNAAVVTTLIFPEELYDINCCINTTAQVILCIDCHSALAPQEVVNHVKSTHPALWKNQQWDNSCCFPFCKSSINLSQLLIIP